ncbi:MAG: response regulator transcription factor [Tissierellia bacterium]|nr:response regulator transcription factor [Tissierellia bacterium]
MKTILVVEDDFEIASLIKEYLERNGYRAIWSSTGFEALEDIELYEIDLVVLDIMMADLDGFGFLERLRLSKNTPVIIVSARITIEDKVRGFELGADDYITKPFSLVELKTRIAYHLRRGNPNDEKTDADHLCFEGGLEYFPMIKKFTLKGERLNLTSKEIDIIDLMIKNEGRVLSKKEIYETVWAEQDMEGNNTITVHIKSIREKLKEDLKEPKYIETVWGKGYRFIGVKQYEN